MDEPRRGEIYLVQFPDEAKARPALIVSPDVRNRLANDVILVPLTTTTRPAPTHVFLEAGEGGLRYLSVAKCEQVTTVPKDLLQRGPLGGRVSLVRMYEIERAIMRAIGVAVT
jgi:mRNA-degrading endonuclease toxin of MazEF toxin-antitoxin module